MSEDNREDFCNQPIGPWIVGVIVISIMLVIWIVMKREDIIHSVEMEQPVLPKIKMSTAGEPSFPTAVTPAAFNKQTPVDTNYRVAAITKATPNGGMQLVANQTNGNGGGFQNSLKDAVNSIIPTVCDVHARRAATAPNVKKNVDAQNLKFVPPFSGAIDKFVENKGFENIGAGMLVDQRGYVLTNYHVTQDATDIVVTVFGPPSQDYHADIVASDPANDLALIKIKAAGTFPEAKIGDSSFTQIGDYVIAVGSPFGIEQTVTSGIISGIRKSIVIEGVRYQNLFQTDTPINRGSSGGPLVNLRGEVIGINSAIYAPTGVFSGTGFAIPINDCKDFLAVNLGRNYSIPVDQKGMLAPNVADLNKTQKGPIPIHFGIEVMPVNDIIAKQFGISEHGGVLVNRVLDVSPASFAGIQRGDIVVSVAGVPVKGMDDIPKIVAHFKTGDNVNVRILRNGKIDEVLVKLQ
ncbi:MAG: trypsin-like peptidase domain-containing protein [Candidatus Omnitrophica bacterium]|nr:trypsin-like peptidase domain-containing protein [Candidatus Omnitrophota bacterium]